MRLPDSVKHILFVHPVVAASDAETFKLIDRAIGIAQHSKVTVDWLVAKDTVEERLMQPILKRYGFSVQIVQ
ncbi:hypothetical protein H9P43_004457 [Blastocladiella emersonii ATCC 22665]|nr:hypothetical protein H9P43_004457 [Blastocladiella emersonii ATCC 22665]